MDSGTPPVDGDSKTSGEPAIAERVFRRLLDLIKQGVLKPGQALPSERELAESMGVGRPSLREALRALAILGVIDIRRREGIFVKPLDLGSLLEPLQMHLSLDARSLDELFEARMLFEPGIAELAAQRVDGADLVALRNCIERGAGTRNDPVAFQGVDEEFHELIADIAANNFLLRIAQSFWELGKASRQITRRLPGVMRQSHEDHQRILEALERRDPAAANAAMRQHLSNVQTAYHLSRIDLRRGSKDGVEEGASAAGSTGTE